MKHIPQSMIDYMSDMLKAKKDNKTMGSHTPDASAVNAISNISSVGTYTVNPTPTIGGGGISWIGTSTTTYAQQLAAAQGMLGHMNSQIALNEAVSKIHLDSTGEPHEITIDGNEIVIHTEGATKTVRNGADMRLVLEHRLGKEDAIKLASALMKAAAKIQIRED